MRFARTYSALLSTRPSSSRSRPIELRSLDQVRVLSVQSDARIEYGPETDFLREKTKPRPVNRKANDIAIVGGGITGLATAYNLTQLLPNAKVTIYEAGKNLGGWMQSEFVPTDDGKGEVLFEWGPRSLRTQADGLMSGFTTHLLARLKMTNSIIATSDHAPASRNRYIYYPDHLVRMPGPIPGAGPLLNFVQNVSTLFKEPIFKGILWSGWKEKDVPVRGNIEDESVGSFVSRRFGPRIADNLVSAMMHGIYAGDLYNLSMRTLMPTLWHLEKLSDSGLIMGYMRLGERRLVPTEDIELIARQAQAPKDDSSKGVFKAIVEKLAGSSVFTFRKDYPNWLQDWKKNCGILCRK